MNEIHSRVLGLGHGGIGEVAAFFETSLLHSLHLINAILISFDWLIALLTGTVRRYSRASLICFSIKPHF